MTSTGIIIVLRRRGQEGRYFKYFTVEYSDVFADIILLNYRFIYIYIN